MRIQSLPKFFLAAFALFLSANILHAQATESEPNNTPAQASTLPLNGNGSGAINPAGDVDWWKVTTNADGKFYVILNNTGNPDLKTLSLYDTAGTILLNSGNIGDGIGGFFTDGLAQGTFYIKINGPNGTETGAYTVSDSLVPASKPNDIEPNNNINQAERLLLNDSATGHIGYYYNNQRDTADWYKVTTNVDGKLNIILNTTEDPGIAVLVVLSLYDTTGTPLLNSSNVGNGVGGITTNGLAAGTYYIKLHVDGSSNNFGPYTLSDSLIPASKPNDIEPNNNFTEAEVLAINATTTGHIGYYYNHQRDTSDWYKLTTTNRGKLQIILDNSGNPDLITLSLYDSTGSMQLYSANVGDGVGGIQTDTLSVGNYFIQITGNGDPNNFGPYTLTDSLSGTLPVTFISFNGILQNNSALLNWSTANEINNKGFEVERSNDGETFTDISFVTGRGNSSNVNRYTYTDNKIVSGSNYYRLKQIDFDGRFSYSSTIRLDFTKFDWAILGNPTSNNSWVQLQLDKAAKVSIQIVSINGNIIQTINKGQISAGTYSVPLNLNNAAHGMFVVKLMVDNNSYSKKIIK
ncbi:MAG: T9SS type A sorting domain-containing protein [Chitinophagaceae bacterium]